MPTSTLIVLIVGIVWVLFAMVMFIVRESMGGEFNMNYQKIGKDILEGTKTVLECIFTITYAASSIGLFVSAYTIDRLNKVKDVDYTVDLELFGHTYTLKLTA